MRIPIANNGQNREVYTSMRKDNMMFRGRPCVVWVTCADGGTNESTKSQLAVALPL